MWKVCPVAFIADWRFPEQNENLFLAERADKFGKIVGKKGK